MIVPEKNASVQGNLVFAKEVDMGIDKNFLAPIIEHLISQYTAPYKATLQEQASNAIDSHVRAGQTRPIEISLPSKLSPNLIIQDWGTGMDRDKLEAYGQFGFTDKGLDNNEKGGFGLGSKAALAMTSQYTVTSVKDGFEDTIVIGRRANNAPFMGFRSAEPIPTNAPNGTTVIIPTADGKSFQSYIDDDLFLGWAPGTVLIDGEEPKYSVHNKKIFLPLGDKGWLVRPDFEKKSFASYYNATAIIEGVKYPINWNAFKNLSINRNALSGFLANIVFKLDNGSVGLLRSREGLIYDSETEKVVSERANELIALGHADFNKRVEAAPTRREAFRLVLQALRLGFTSQFTWHGEVVKIPDHVTGRGTYGAASEEKSVGDLTFVSLYPSTSTRSQFSLSRGLDTVETYWFRRYTDIERLDKAGRRILITKASHKKAIRKPRSTYDKPSEFHPESGSSITLAKAIAGPNGHPNTIGLFYTDAPREKMDPWFLSTFDQIVTADDAAILVDNYKRAHAKELAAARALTKGPKTPPMARLLSYNSGGRSGYTEVELSLLAQESCTYILLQTDASVLDTKAKESLTTRVGYQDYRSLESVLSYLLKLTISDSKIPGTPKKYRFLVEPKSKGTKSYASMLKMISLKDAIEAEFKQAIKVNEVSHEAAKMDRLAGANGWAKSLSDKDIDLIDNEETKLWAQTMKQPRDEVAREFIKNVHALPTTSYGLVLPEDTSSRIADPRPVSPGDRYPLLKHVGNISANTKAAIQYINLIDSHLSKQTS